MRKYSCSGPQVGDLGAQKRGLLVQRLARVGDKGGGDAEDLVLDEGGAHGIPDGVAAGLKGRAQAARREARRVGLALDELLAGEVHQDGAVLARVDEAVMLLGGDARQRLEPVREVRGTVLERPVLHRVGHLVGDVDVERLALLDDLHEFLVRRLRQTLLHVCIGKEQAPVLLRDFVGAHCCPSLVVRTYPNCLKNTLALFPRSEWYVALRMRANIDMPAHTLRGEETPNRKKNQAPATLPTPTRAAR